MFSALFYLINYLLNSSTLSVLYVLYFIDKDEELAVV
jgi:hypothetical protein